MVILQSGPKIIPQLALRCVEIAFGTRLWHAALMTKTAQTQSPKTISWRSLLLLGGIFPAILVALDQWSKWATTRFFQVPMSVCAEGNPRLTHEVSPIADLSLLCNRGISWGMLQGDSPIKRWVLTIFAFIMVAVFISVLRKTEDRFGQIALMFVIAGAVGNAIDRLLFGAVTDMIDFSDIGFNYVFNVADSYITVGVVAFIISIFLTDRREKAAAKSAVQ